MSALVRHRTDSPWRTWASPQGFDYTTTSTESATQSKRLVLNPTHIAHRNQRRACVATGDIPPETCGCDGAVVVPQCIAARPQADWCSPKTRQIRTARKSSECVRHVFLTISRTIALYY